MRSRFKIIGFASGVFIITFLVFGCTIGLVSIGWMTETPTFMWEILALFSIGTIVIYYYLQRVQHSEPFDFVKKFLLSIVLKLITGGIIISIIMRLDIDGGSVNATYFILNYLIFTGYEIAIISTQKNTE